MPLWTVGVTRYVTPLREGGSLPAIVEADDDGLYVLKFRGAGQGSKALVAEVIAGEIGRALGLPVPELVLADLDPELARTEPDPEIHALIMDSGGTNAGVDYLPGSIAFDPIVHAVTPDLASRIVWFDAYTMNVDRTAKNTNILMWHRQPWLIDHGASMYFHHSPEWAAAGGRSRDPFPLIAQHVLLHHATMLEEVDPVLTARLDEQTLEAIVGLVPDAWLADHERPSADVRRAYRDHLAARLAAPRPFLAEALRAR